MLARQLPTSRRRASRGFTLVELMVVVGITGILATIGISLVWGHMRAAKAKEAAVGVAAIKVAEEAYRSQYGQYLNVSTSDPATFYPAPVPGKVRYDWRQAGQPDVDRWMALGVPRNNGTPYVYLVNAGRPGDPLPTLHTTAQPDLGTPTDMWFVIQVRGDLDGDGKFMNAAATSYNGELYIENETE